MVVRLPGGMPEVRKRERYGHNSGETLSDLEQRIRAQRIEHWPIDKVRTRLRNPRQLCVPKT